MLVLSSCMTCLCLDEVVRNTDVKRGAEAGRLWVRGCNSKKTNTRENRNEHVKIYKEQ